MNKFFSGLLLAIFLLVAFQGAEAVTIVPTSQDRFISAGANTGNTADSDGANAAGFGQFNTSVTATATDPPPDGASATSSSSQDSQILDASLLGVGSASGSSSSGIPGAGSSSNFEVYFELTETSNYSLNGNFIITHADTGTGGVIFGDEGINPHEIFGYETFIEGPGLFSDAGVLDPGDYWLYVFLTADTLDGYSSPSNSFSFDLEFTPTVVPEPASCFLFLSGLAGLYGIRSGKKK